MFYYARLPIVVVMSLAKIYLNYCMCILVYYMYFDTGYDNKTTRSEWLTMYEYIFMRNKEVPIHVHSTTYSYRCPASYLRDRDKMLLLVSIQCYFLQMKFSLMCYDLTCKSYSVKHNCVLYQNITVYPKKYAHGFCFAVLCCGYTLTDFPISIRLTSLALWQSNDCPSASKATLMNMDKYLMWIHYKRLHNHNKAKHNKTVCIFLGIYCTWMTWITGDLTEFKSPSTKRKLSWSFLGFEHSCALSCDTNTLECTHKEQCIIYIYIYFMHIQLTYIIMSIAYS